MGKDKNKREVESDSDSGPDDPNPPKKSKSTVKQSASKGSDEEPTWTLDKKRFLKVRSFKGKTFVDIREYYEDASGNLMPGKKGISLSVQQWKKVQEAMDEVDEALKNM
ncbi:RNA polymerase II transcriptional coactivator-like isoform X3 [Artemia franciscana]|uniref:RNA polymerase II transcriptional coactivator n=1 Tax=Artemia franciscana TaxID=6661 RepID=A8D8C5_ARTSF|nr:RNA polymerase II transcriptional coactivator [Artemia franciscana]